MSQCVCVRKSRKPTPSPPVDVVWQLQAQVWGKLSCTSASEIALLALRWQVAVTHGVAVRWSRGHRAAHASESPNRSLLRAE